MGLSSKLKAHYKLNPQTDVQPKEAQAGHVYNKPKWQMLLQNQRIPVQCVTAQAPNISLWGDRHDLSLLFRCLIQ